MKASVSNGRKPRDREQINVYVRFVSEDDRTPEKKQPASEPRPRTKARRSRAGA